MSHNIEIRPVRYGSDEYEITVHLRSKILREPLKITFTEEQLQKEKDDWHLALFHDQKVAACLVLTPSGSKIQMRQVAVDDQYQRRGFGKKLVIAAEKFCLERGFSSIFCHARKDAVPFYLQLNYIITKGPFMEIGIEHYEMEKELLS